MENGRELKQALLRLYVMYFRKVKGKLTFKSAQKTEVNNRGWHTAGLTTSKSDLPKLMADKRFPRSKGSTKPMHNKAERKLLEGATRQIQKGTEQFIIAVKDNEVVLRHELAHVHHWGTNNSYAKINRILRRFSKSAVSGFTKLSRQRKYPMDKQIILTELYACVVEEDQQLLSILLKGKHCIKDMEIANQLQTEFYKWLGKLKTSYRIITK